MADFTLRSLRKGVNNSDPEIGIPDEQCSIAENVEFWLSMLGERRLGTSEIDVPTSITDHDYVPFVYRHIPATDITDAELWVMGATGTSSATLARKTTTWATITMADTPTLSGFSPYDWQAVSLHGKIFIAYNSSVDRLHCVDAGSTTMRRTGLAAPAAPTAADDGGAGTFSGTRYYRVRYTVRSGSTTLRRSEPSASLAFTPNGNDTGVTVTKPASISESETHWELEASLDDVNFYRIATTAVGTTTVTDTQDERLGYGDPDSGFDLSEGAEDYALIPSGKFLIVDDDRLLILSSHEDSAYASRVTWTPVGKADGVGNDERIETDTDPVRDLDGLEGGGIVGAARASFGVIWVFKDKGVYKLIRTGTRTSAYDVVCYTKDLGAVPGSIVAGLDQMGRPCVYFIDPTMGPHRAGAGGIKQCGMDIVSSWEDVNLAATRVVCSSVFYPAKRQVIWNIATGSANIPNLGLLLQTNETREVDDGVRYGWSTFDGVRASALSMCLFSTNIDANTARNRLLKPFIGLENAAPVHISDTGSTDNGTAYHARIRTKPYYLKSLLYKFTVERAALLMKMAVGALLNVRLVRDFDTEVSAQVNDVKLEPEHPLTNESCIVKSLDSLSGSELKVVQFEFFDTDPAGEQWEIHQLAVKESQDGNN